LELGLVLVGGFFQLLISYKIFAVQYKWKELYDAPFWNNSFFRRRLVKLLNLAEEFKQSCVLNSNLIRTSELN
jgi:hypothetical protein